MLATQGVEGVRQMLFNSYEFIFLFLPVVCIGYFLLSRYRSVALARFWLAASGLFFYSWWNIANLPILILSITFNYISGTRIAKSEGARKKTLLIFSVTANLLLLGYYKYADFFLSNLNALAGTKLALLNIVLPLGISFFTFTQIAYLVDAYRGQAKEYNAVNYILFVTFFPHLIAGPILHHKEMMPQFASLKNKVLNWENVSRGLVLFSIGLCKKVIIADTLAQWASPGFKLLSLSMVEAWSTALSYTFQIYFDFSGYTDMAIGIALMFNILLPQNFDSPYKSASIIEFWRRWHMTLSRFLRDYVYIPLGGNRKGSIRRYLNLFITMAVGGLWHGASWTFVIWGMLHGAMLIVNHLWRALGLRMHWLLGRLLTFFVVMITWIIFRAESFGQALVVLKGLVNVHNVGIHVTGITQALPAGRVEVLALIGLYLFVSVFKNSTEWVNNFQPDWKWAVAVSGLLMAGIIGINRVSEFLYFQF